MELLYHLVVRLQLKKVVEGNLEREGLVVWVIDDDAYRFLNPAPPPSFAHLYPERTLRLQSLTKPPIS